MDKRFIFTPKKIPQGTIAEYQVNTRESIYFNQDHLFTMLYLIRFSYFDRNIFQAIYSSVSKNETYNRNFFQELIGNRNFPISKATQYTYQRRHVYYLNLRFRKWLFSFLEEHDVFGSFLEMYETKEVTAIRNYPNLYTGGEPKINEHDFLTRYVTAQVIFAISKITERNLYQQLLCPIFPVDRSTSNFLVSDALLYVDDKPYFIELDNGTENQTRLLSKVLRYEHNQIANGSSVFFSFNVKEDEKYSRRISNFFSKINNAFVRGNPLPVILKQANITFYGFNLASSPWLIAHSICRTEHLIELPRGEPIVNYGSYDLQEQLLNRQSQKNFTSFSNEYVILPAKELGYHLPFELPSNLRVERTYDVARNKITSIDEQGGLTK